MNPVIDAIRSRRSIRAYGPEQVKQVKLDGILEAGGFAPSAMNGQTWHFTVIRIKEKLDRLSAMVKEALEGMDHPGIWERLKNPDWHAFYGAPVLVVVSGRQDALFHATDCAAATQNMLLAAHSLGIGSCWIGIIARLFEGPRAEGLSRELRIPDGYKPLYGVALGYPSGEQPQAASRREGTIDYAD